jgi:hypothetical protein
MPYYRLECLDCAHTDEFFVPLSAWSGLKKEEVPYPTVCPKCKSKKFVRNLDRMAGQVKPGAEGTQNRIRNQVREDMARIGKGDMDFLANVAGTNDRSKAPSGVKYMKDVKGKAAIKRKT